MITISRRLHQELVATCAPTMSKAAFIMYHHNYIIVILFEVPVFRLAGVGTIPERKSQHFFNALDFIVTNISKVNTDIKQPHKICSIEHTWLFCLFSGYFCVLFYLVLQGTLKSVCVCLEGGGHVFPSDQMGVYVKNLLWFGRIWKYCTV